MFKRLFFGLLGLGAGVTLGVWAVRKVDATASKLTPEELARSAAGRASSLGARLGDALAEGRQTAAAREAELRAVHGIDPPPQP